MPLYNLSKSKWELLKLISKKEYTTSQIAKLTNTSNPNVSQQLTLLEAKGYVKKENKTTDKKRIIYKLKNSKLALITLNNNPERKEINSDKETNFLVNIIMSQTSHKQTLINFYYQNTNLIKLIDELHLIDEDKKNIHLLIITKEVEEFRKTNQISIGHKTLIFWSHNHIELKQGIENKEAYFLDKLKNSKVLIK